MDVPAPLPRFRAPANVLLARAQLVLMLATLVPTVLMTALGIVLLALGSDSVNLNLLTGLLLLAFCTTSLTGYILGSMFVSRGASLARVQNDFVSSVSHELRTPLTSIRMFIDTLRTGRVTDPAEQKRCLDLIHQEVERLHGLVTRVIELSRIETGRRPFANEPVSLDDLAKDVVAAFDASTLSKPTQIELQIEPGLEVMGDRETLGTAVGNLLLNAYKYTPAEDRRIALTIESSSDREVDIVVKDNGPGIPKAEQAHIFETFERGQTAIDGRTSGSGLGLAIVRAIVRAHKGKVEVRSRPGEGAEFRLRLKRRPKQKTSS